MPDRTRETTLLDIDPGAISTLAGQVRGRVLRPGDGGFEETRRVWNGMIDRTPAVIVRCTGVADVLRALEFARRHGLVITVRGGGHNVAGNAVCDGGLMIDLSPMKGLRVEPRGRSVEAQGGLTWGEFDHETQAFGLATTGGLITTTGIAGLTLGGGIGWLGRRFGLACDNLLSADVVTADGRLVTASAEENADLFGGLHGGGGNFGIVTSFRYRLHPVSTVLAGLIAYPFAQARDVLRRYREVIAAAPDELTAYAALLTLPDGPQAAAILACYSGPAERAERVVAPLRNLGQPLADTVGPVPYTVLQGMYDAGSPPGERNYWKSGFLSELHDGAIDALIEHLAGAPLPHSNMILEHLGGAIAHVPEDDTAFVGRSARFNALIVAAWQDRSDDDSIAWARRAYGALLPHLQGGVYVNYLTGDPSDRVEAAYGASKYARLSALKRKYDPENVFRLNQNIRP
jgi:FAD/FMN-containing dehydrogenase